MSNKKDLYHNILAGGAEATGNQCIAAVTAAADVTGEPIDTLGYDGVTVVVNLGDSAGTPDGTDKWNIYIHVSDASGSGFAVPASDDDVLGTCASGVIHTIDDATTKDNITIMRGYVGPKRYIKVFGDKIASGPNQPISADVILSHGRAVPTV
jgi:hypothetical protein